MEEFEGKDVQFISITNNSRGQTLDSIEKFLEDTEMKGWIGFDADSSMFKDYGVRGIPHTVLVYPGGKIANAKIHPNRVDSDTIQDLIDHKSY